MHYARKSGVTRWSRGTVVLSKDQSIDDNHPLLEERPDLFTDEKPGASLAGPPVVERATAAPGEIRTTPATGPRRGGKPVTNTAATHSD